MESALQCSAMKDFAAVITAMGKPDTKLHALELAKQGDQRYEEEREGEKIRKKQEGKKEKKR